VEESQVLTPFRVDSKPPHDLEENLRNMKTTIVIAAVTLRGYVESQFIRECRFEASLGDDGEKDPTRGLYLFLRHDVLKWNARALPRSRPRSLVIVFTGTSPPAFDIV